MKQLSKDVYVVTREELRGIKRTAYRRGAKRGLKIGVYEANQLLSASPFPVQLDADAVLDLADRNRRLRPI